MSELTANELLQYIKKNGITLVKTTKDFKKIPKGTKLYLGRWEGYVSSYDCYTEKKNKKFNYDFDYEWEASWYDYYKGKFIILEENEEVKVIKKEEIPTKIKYKNRVYVLEENNE
jgi:hypothetical protein